MVRYTPLTYKMVREAIIGFVPQNLQSFILGILAEVYGRSTAIVPISAIFALWSGCRGVQSITNGLNVIYHVKETRNWLVTRIYSAFYTLLFCACGYWKPAAAGQPWKPDPGDGCKICAHCRSGDRQDHGVRTFLVFAVLFFIFLALYKVLPNRRATFKSQVPGAFLTALAWMGFSLRLFSVF